MKIEKARRINPVPDKYKNRTLNRADGRKARRFLSRRNGTFNRALTPFQQLLKGG